MNYNVTLITIYQINQYQKFKKMIKVSDFYNKYFYVFSDCFVTNGAKQLSILDTSKGKIYFMNSDYYYLFELMEKEKVGDIILSLNSSIDVKYFCLFIQKLIDLNVGIFVDDISLFPPISKKWEVPSLITNSIVDIRDIFHDFDQISNELNKCRCKHVQIRAFDFLEICKINNIILSFKEKSFLSVEFIIKYIEEDQYLKKVEDLAKKNTFTLFTLYGAPEDRVKNDKMKRIKIVLENFNSHECCGKINKEYYIKPNIQSFMENYLYNGCLNKKISIDEKGEIKNCPSMKKSFGNISNSSILQIAKDEEFQSLWNINKRQIKVCKDCEYRCICTDCRAFLSDNNDIFSKPANCFYDPYNLKWNN